MRNLKPGPTAARPFQPLRRSRALKVTALALLLLSAVCLAFWLYYWWQERPQPTVAGWAATVTRLAGDGAPGLLDDLGPQARFADPFGVAVDRTGNVYVSDAGRNNRIRQITPEGMVKTLAGSAEGFADGPALAAAFNSPSGLAIDRAGNLYVADTGNNRIRKVTPDGVVTTIAGDGTAGYRDGPALTAQFNGPCGVAVDRHGNVYVADTYNDRIRQITTDHQVKTLAGGGQPGYQDGPASAALFDTPCAVAVSASGELFIADTGNNRIRRLTPRGEVTTCAIATPGAVEAGSIGAPLGLALTHDNFLYVTEKDHSRVLQIAPDGTARVMAGVGYGFANGAGLDTARFNRPAGIAVDWHGALYVADSANYLVRKLAPMVDSKAMAEPQELSPLPRLTADTLQVSEFPWPVDPQQQWHEVVATLGEVRGSYDGESRHHLHSGIDVPGADGAIVRAVLDEKVSNPLSTWGTGGLGEGLQVGAISYIHLRVGREQKDVPIDPIRFAVLNDEQGKPRRVRVKRGTRFRIGDPLGTINRMYHVHLNLGPWGAEVNPLLLPFIGFSDTVAPTIERDGIQLFDPTRQRLTAQRKGRLIVHGDVSIVVDAYDQVDRNLARRRLGLYKLGYQVLKPDGSLVPGFEQPRINIKFDRLPPEREAVKIAYADTSGITVYGSAATKFLYVLTNTVRDGQASSGVWRSAELPPGDYVLRIIAADLAGNEAMSGRNLPISIE